MDSATTGNNRNHLPAAPDPLSIAINDTITVQFNGLGNTILPPLTLLEVDDKGITGAYQEGDEGPVQVYWIPWQSIRFLSKTALEE